LPRVKALLRRSQRATLSPKPNEILSFVLYLAVRERALRPSEFGQKRSAHPSGNFNLFALPASTPRPWPCHRRRSFQEKSGATSTDDDVETIAGPHIRNLRTKAGPVFPQTPLHQKRLYGAAVLPGTSCGFCYPKQADFAPRSLKPWQA